MAKLLCLGDSIMYGITGYDAAHPRADPTIPDKIGQLIGTDVDNEAKSGTSVNDGTDSMVSLLPGIDLSQYDYILLGYGTNDWGLNHESLEALQAGLNVFASDLGMTGTSPYVLVELPTESFINGATDLDSKNALGISQNQVCDTLKNFATDNGYHYYDWRDNPIITPQNRHELCGDGELHPTNDTQQKMAQRLADYIIKTRGNSPTPSPTPAPEPQSQPTPEPTVKTVDEIKLDNLTDIFGIGTNVSNGTDKVMAKLNELYKLLVSLVGSDKTEVQAPLVSPGDAPSRSLRSYVIQTFLELNEMVNDFIQVCNSHWILDPKTGDKTAAISLSRPENLVLNSDYTSVINQNWQAIETVINKLIGYINQILKGE